MLLKPSPTDGSRGVKLLGPLSIFFRPLPPALPHAPTQALGEDVGQLGQARWGKEARVGRNCEERQASTSEMHIPVSPPVGETSKRSRGGQGPDSTRISLENHQLPPPPQQKGGKTFCPFLRGHKTLSGMTDSDSGPYRGGANMELEITDGKANFPLLFLFETKKTECEGSEEFCFAPTSHLRLTVPPGDWKGPWSTHRVMFSSSLL